MSAGVTSVTASPNPFTPTGSNSTTVTVQATPGQTGLVAALSLRGLHLLARARASLPSLPLTETSPGVYTAQWDAVTTATCQRAVMPSS